jgi:hypothetical protein
MLRVVLITCVSALLIAAGPARQFTIAGVPFAEAEIVDARAQPDIARHVSITLTFSENAAVRLAKLLGNAAAPVVLDGKAIAALPKAASIPDGVLELTGTFTLAEAMLIARKISGKAPLPDSLDDGP